MRLVVKNLVLIPVHIDPDDAENELEALDDVVEDARETLETDISFKSITYNQYVKYGTKNNKFYLFYLIIKQSHFIS